MKPLYSDDLGSPSPACSTPGCTTAHGDDLWFHSSCHPSSPTWARYVGDVLTIQCARCGIDLVALKLASRPPPEHN